MPSRAFLLGVCAALLVFTPPADALLAPAEKTEIEVTGNPHDPSGCSVSNEGTSCSSSCQPRLLLEPHLILRTPMITQPDTLIEVTTKKVLSVPVPIYHFHQPARLSPRELPFKLVLVTEIGPRNIPDLRHIPVDRTVASDSWFPGFYWTPVICGQCESYVHVGWKFTSLANESEYFYALIVEAVEKERDGITNGVAAYFAEGLAQAFVVGQAAPGWMVGALGSGPV